MGGEGVAAVARGAVSEAGGPPVRVMLVDDDALVRRLLATILEAAGLRVVSQAADGDEVVEAVRAHRPDVVVMDLRMERVGGVEATRLVRALPDAPGVVALTSFDTESAILDALLAGASRFLAKDAAPHEIVSAVQQVASGDGALSPRAARTVVQRMQAGSADGERRPARRLLEALTPRELEIARGVSEGRSNAEVAALLYISEATVKTHLNQAMHKTGVSNRVQLAVLVTRARLSGH